MAVSSLYLHYMLGLMKVNERVLERLPELIYISKGSALKTGKKKKTSRRTHTVLMGENPLAVFLRDASNENIT